jgi:hypothetical protein
MSRRITTALLLFLVLMAVPVRAADSDFKRANPDIDKYLFARDFITSLSYYNRVVLRLKEGIEVKPNGMVLQMLATIKDLTLDNTDLRIARNYLTKFLSSRNGLIQEVTRRAVDTYDQLLVLNSRDRALWMGYQRFKTLHQPPDYNESDFISQQVRLALDYKEVAKGLLEASVLFQKVLLSAQRCETDSCKELVLTQAERDKLAKRLDTFSGNNLEWGLKPGQTTIQGCVAALREVLEDPLYISHNP